MAWSAITIGTIHGITGAIAGITSSSSDDYPQIASAKTFLLAEVAGICTSIYNGAKLQAEGNVETTRAFSFTLVPLNLSL